MFVDLTHNKIVRETMSDAFRASVEEKLVPMLTEVFGDRLDGIQFYEDYIGEKFAFGGEWYYPLTVVHEGAPETYWIKWQYPGQGLFRDLLPYSYVGLEPLEFVFAECVPADFSDKLKGRAIYCEPGVIPMKVHSTAPGASFLSGKYSQTFLDEMARQLTARIEESCGVLGVGDGGVELEIVFTPETYMEHTSANVTYRRLLMSARGCAPRDFWVKWTRLDLDAAYTVSDTPVEGTIRFELGEDVSQKIREKEYRFLAFGNPDKYQASMGKKNITEWRDLIKRALKRGDLLKNADLPEGSAPAINAELADLLAACGVAVPAASAAPAPSASTSIEDALRDVIGAPAAEEPEPEAFEEAPVAAPEEPLVLEMPAAPEEPEEEPEEEIEEEVVSAPEEPAPLFREEKEEPAPFDEARIRAEIEAKIRLEYEERARKEAEAEAERLRREREALIAENERLAAEARAAAERKNEEEARLRAELEAKAKAEARERERLAEAARIAMEEQRAAEEARAAELRAAEEARLREEARQKEEARLRAEEEARARAMEEAKARAEEERRRAEREAKIRAEEEAKIRAEYAAAKPAPAPASAAEPAPAPAPAPKPEPKYTYVARNVKILFRHAVDPNITKRLHEIITQTLVYLGKEDLFMRVRATIPEPNIVLLEFVKFPKEENELLVNIIKVIGNGDLGVSKIILE